MGEIPPAEPGDIYSEQRHLLLEDKFMFIGVMEDLSARQNLEHVSLPLRGKVARFSVTDE